MKQDLITSIIYLLVGVSVLLIGMRLMSGGLKKSIGRGTKKFFKKTSNNPFSSMGIGALVTAGIQSSDATNAMVIGFINAGAMTLFQGLSIMLGAYIGTTVTGVLASFSSLNISVYLLLFTFVGTILMLFFKSDKLKNIGEILAGLGLLFFGLAVTKTSFNNAEITGFFQNLFSSISFGPLLFIFGVLITALLQSSSAVTAIVIAMVGSGAINLSCGLFLVLGATLGTVTNTLLVSIGGSVQGKRAAWIAFTMRTITSLIALTILCIFEKPISNFFTVFQINGSNEFPIAMFTVIYNVIFMPLLIPFIKPFIRLFTKIIKDKEADKYSKAIHFIDDAMLKTPAIATFQVENEVINMLDLSRLNFELGYKKLILKNDDFDSEIETNENTLDYLNKRITDFLISLSTKVDSKTEKEIGSLFHVVNDIERIGDHAYNFLEMANEMKEKDLAFSSFAIDEVSKMFDLVFPMFDLARDILANRDNSKLKLLHDLEEKTDVQKKVFSTNHYQRITVNKCSPELTPYITSLTTDLERVADHLTNIGYSVTNPTGDEENKNE